MTTQTTLYEYARQGLALSPDRAALWFYGRPVRYRELFRRIDNAADNLFALGVREGTVVTLHLPNCPQAVVAVYAIAKLGGICNMVHPLTPLAALGKNMRFTQSGILITGDHFAEAGKVDFADTLIYVDMAAHMGLLFGSAYRLKNRNRSPMGAVSFERLEKPAAQKAAIPDQKELGSRCAVYLNSSGTTGMPKTVMHSHEACNNWVANAVTFFRGQALRNETLLAVLPLFHGSGLIMNLHQLICAGGTQVLLAKWNAKQAAREIQKRKVTVLTGVPYLYQNLLEQKGFSGKAAGRITQCYVSGDAVPKELKVALDARVGHRVLFEGYGMSETVTACFSGSIHNPKLEASGYPLVNCFAAVLDEAGNIQTRGTGELLVRTNTMMLGYLKDPAATEQAFLRRDGNCWFRTGDVGEIDEEGYLYFRQRKKDIIIRNGYNIYPREVEAVIGTVPAVSDVVVTGHKQPGTKGDAICAFVVLNPEEDQTAAKERILGACKNALPGYAVPNRIVFTRKLPRNNMAKVDKKELESLL